MKVKIFLCIFLFFVGFCLSGMGEVPSEIECSVTVKPDVNNCVFNLTVKNNTGKDIVLKFMSGKKYDFIVKNFDGKEIWKWSEGRVFTQSIMSMKLKSDYRKSFQSTWDYSRGGGKKVSAGTYSVQGVLNVSPNPLKTEWKEFYVKTDYMPKLQVLKGKIRVMAGNVYLLGNDGTAYHIKTNSDEFLKLDNQTIDVTSYEIFSIPGSVDKEIVIKEYEK